MLFDIPVKERKEDLFNYRKEFNELSEAIRTGERLAVVKGPRRVGKSSLMKVVYNELGMPKAWIDARKLFAGVSPEGLLYEAFLSILEQLKIEERAMARVKSLTLGGFGAELRQPRASKIAEEAEAELKARKKKAVVFIDEAQILKVYDVDRFLAYVYDSLGSIQLVLAGSQIGLLEEFVGRSATAPLFGRAKTEITLNRLPSEKAVEFLRMGFEQAKAGVPDSEIENAISVIDGLIGWLNYYGHYRMKYSHARAIETLKKDAAEITSGEIKRFFDTRKGKKERYLILLKALSGGPLSWEELKTRIEIKEKNEISDSRLDKYLRDLREYSLVERSNGHYILSDPLIKESLTSDKIGLKRK